MIPNSKKLKIQIKEFSRKLQKNERKITRKLSNPGREVKKKHAEKEIEYLESERN